MIGLPELAVSSPISYLLAFLVPALDAIFPVLPSETVVIALGVATAGSVDPRIGLLVGLAAAGAFAGDNACYFIGRRFGPTAERWIFSGERGQRRRAWATGALDRFGARLIIVCRFIPGGRTAVTLTCGVVDYPRRSFVPATACAGAIWAVYAFLLGRVGGKAFEDRPWLGFIVAFGATLVLSVLIEATRRLKPWLWFRRPVPPARPGPARPGPGGSGPGSPPGPPQDRPESGSGSGSQASDEPSRYSRSAAPRDSRDPG